MTELLDKMGYGHKWMKNDFLRITYTNSGSLNYNRLGGEFLHVN